MPSVCVANITVAVAMDKEASALTNRADEQHDSERDETSSAERAEIWINLFRSKRLRRCQHKTEYQDTDRVRHRDGDTKQHALASRAALSDEVSRHHGLAMPWVEGVKCPEDERDGRSQQRQAK